MHRYSSITIIYNPNSTGPGQALAEDLAAVLQPQLPGIEVSVIATTHRGHAGEVTYAIATSAPRPLIISASGDGGYNEVVNGAMRAQVEGHTPIVGLLPAGNANDHHTSLHENDLATAIVAGKPTSIDVLEMRVEHPKKSITTYAHSYIGLGLSPRVGAELTRAKLNPFNEAWLTIRTLLRAPRCELVLDGKVRTFDNFIISNVPRMAKVMVLAPDAQIDDGRFEVTKHHYVGRLRMFGHLLKASSTGLSDPEVRSTLTFSVRRRQPVQVDGEVIVLEKSSVVTITSLQRVLTCFV